MLALCGHTAKKECDIIAHDITPDPCLRWGDYRKVIQTMPLIILHDLDGDEILVNTDAITAARRKVPDEKSHIKAPFTKLFYVSKDKTSDSIGFPDTVKESPAEIAALSRQ